MNKQKLAVIILSLAVIVMVAMGATSAYFATSEKAHNVITSSGVGVELIEHRINDDGEMVPFEDITDAEPGEIYSKIPQVFNNDDGDVWVRVKVLRTAKLRDGTVLEEEDDKLVVDFDNVNWLQGDNNYYYYNRSLKNGELTEPLFTEVKIAEEVDNKYNGATFGFKLIAQAVQVANNGSDVLSAEGWPEE